MSLLFRLIALVLLAALAYPRGAGPYDRVLLVALDGVHFDYLARLAGSGELPTMARLRERGVEVELFGGAPADPALYWTDAFGGRGHAGDSALLDALAASGQRVVLVHVPGAAGEAMGSVTVLPGPDPGRGFIGNSAGRVEDLASVRRGAVPWPYRSAARELVRLADAIDVGASSAWLEVSAGGEDVRRGVFKAYRLDDSTYYLSPVYRRTGPLPTPINETASIGDTRSTDALYVADDPSSSAASSRTREYLAIHAAELSRARAEAARRMMAGGWDVMVLFETLPGIAWAADTVRSSASSRPTLSDVSAAYAQVDAQLGGLIAAAGPATLVLLMGREAAVGAPEKGAGRASTGFFLAATDEGTSIRAQAELAQAATTLLVALGLPIGRVDAVPIPAVTARYRRARRVAAKAIATRQVGTRVGLELSASTLDRLGALATTAVIAPETDAIVQPEG